MLFARTQYNKLIPLFFHVKDWIYQSCDELFWEWKISSYVVYYPSTSIYRPGAHFTDILYNVIPIQGKICYKDFANAMTAQLLCYVENFTATTNWMRARMKFPANLNYDGKIVAEMGSWSKLVRYALKGTWIFLPNRVTNIPIDNLATTYCRRHI